MHQVFNILVFVFLSLSMVRTDHGYDKKTGILSVPLHRMESGLEKLLNRGADLKLIEGIYNLHRNEVSLPNSLGKPKPKPSNGTLPLFKYFDTEYYGVVNIGKPGHPFNMVMDTAWGYSWVISSECRKLNLACAVHNKYNHKSSSTYKPDNRTFNISKLEGYLSSDVFLVGQMNSSKQVFAEILNLPWFYALHESDGTVGLGFKELTENYVPFFYNFFAQNRLKEPIFSFYINRDPTTKAGGSLFFGGIDTKHNRTAFTELPVNSIYYWRFAVDKISVVMSKKSKQDFCTKGCNATADTSSITIQGPAEEIKAINRIIGATKIYFSDRYMIPCANQYKGPKISFSMNGRDFVITAKDYIQKLWYSGVTVCLSAFQAAPAGFGENEWILGGAFLYQFYSAYDINKRVVMLAEVA